MDVRSLKAGTVAVHWPVAKSTLMNALTMHQVKESAWLRVRGRCQGLGEHMVSNELAVLASLAC